MAIDCVTDTCTRHPAQDAPRSGSGSVTGNIGWGLAQGISAPRERAHGKPAWEGKSRAVNAAGPAATASINAPVETALPGKASGPPSSLANRSVGVYGLITSGSAANRRREEAAGGKAVPAAM